MDPVQAIEQLTWYFHSAESECGNRTPLGTHLEMQRTGISFSSSRPDAELGAASRLDRLRSEASDGNGETWLRTVPRRLACLPARLRGILTAAYSDAVLMAGSDVSVTLACATPAAREGHQASTEAARARLAANHSSRLDWSMARQSCREWLGWLTNAASGSEDSAPRKMLDLILEEATNLRQEALDAYCQDTEGAVAA